MGAPLAGGRAVATIDVEEDPSGYNIPRGAAAEIAVYIPLRIILLSYAAMWSWDNYVFWEGH